MPVALDALPASDFRLVIDLVNEARGKSFGPVVDDEKRRADQLESLADKLRPAARRVGLSV